MLPLDRVKKIYQDHKSKCKQSNGPITFFGSKIFGADNFEKFKQTFKLTKEAAFGKFEQDLGEPDNVEAFIKSTQKHLEHPQVAKSLKKMVIFAVGFQQTEIDEIAQHETFYQPGTFMPLPYNDSSVQNTIVNKCYEAICDLRDKEKLSGFLTTKSLADLYAYDKNIKEETQTL